MSSNYTRVKPEAPCWTCRKACGGCSWSKEFKPVEGWDATENILADGTLRGYEIRFCPEYEKDLPEDRLSRKIDEDGMMLLLEAMAGQMREDYINGKGPYEERDENHSKYYRGPKKKKLTESEIKHQNRLLIEKWLKSEDGLKLLQLSNPDEVIEMLRKLARIHDTEMAKYGVI